MTRFLVLNGPNINVLGRRDPGIYGSMTLEEINQQVAKLAQSLGVEVTFYQSNVEGNLIDCIQENWGSINGIIVNPGAYTHYGYALKDALIDSRVPVVEVHLSNIHAREDFRHHSVIADIAAGQIAGMGWQGYVFALEFLAARVNEGR